MSVGETKLSGIMMERADEDGLSIDHPIRLRAQEFNEACASFYANPQTVNVKKFMGAWARARRIWCEYSGEPLI